MTQYLSSNEDVDAWLAEPGPRWLMKHSNSCGISTTAFDEVQAHAETHPTEPLAVVVIQEHRPVSNYIATKLGRVHQSPQLFLCVDGAVVWTTTHFSITAQAMAEAWAAQAG